MVGSSNGYLGGGNGGPGPDNAAHLLVADDDGRVRDLTSRFLQREGYRVTTAKDAGDARAKLDSLSFDLLILDVVMPGESGFDLANFVRETSQVPILMLTAGAETENGINGLDYMAKPYDPRELLLRVASILKRA
jgi:two-component system phosphate regulon response regulator OmpR